MVDMSTVVKDGLSIPDKPVKNSSFFGELARSLTVPLLLLCAFDIFIYSFTTLADNHMTFTVTKTLACSILGLIAVLNKRWVIASGLILGAVGDAILALACHMLFVTGDPFGRPFFGVGAGIFLIGHFSYIYYAVALHSRSWSLQYLAPFVILGSTFEYFELTQGNGNATLVVPFYVGILALMGWRTTCLPKTSVDNWMVSMAGVLFFISDGTLGFQYFVCDVPHSRVIIMVSYWGAQALFLLQDLHRPRQGKMISKF
ncbi:YhhN-like [Carpediemonas membranifera]|uniref:YhhN-like n=1 Tax=Carpediemonas membranifera TaxID=201153 RepID=A0A8J6BTQ8_9EUKA|nr:YhhN-like [Carpediemonas membranifera]|eukprot:KAG9389601.1 YhhN-like [Carpediemonas membranifera]